MDRFVARQPIFDRRLKVMGYELLFRSGFENQFNGADLNTASASVLAQSFFPIDLDVFTRGRKAFINFTRDVLVKEYATLLPPGNIVVEILENVEPDEEVIAACGRLKKLGYTLALDDFVDSDAMHPLIALADIIKVDIQAVTAQQQEEWARRYSHKGILMLAEKVETQRQYEEAASFGYAYFQGYFFSKPQVVSRRDISGYKRRYLQILQAVNKPEPDIFELEEMLKPEVSLCYKLLRYLNSACFGFRGEIRSIRHALNLLGLREFKKWVSLIITASLGTDKPEELFVCSAIRARFCEALSDPIGMQSRAPDLFIMGLFSLLEAILDSPMSSVLQQMPISPDVQAALLGEQNLLGNVHQLCVAYEKGDWQTSAQVATRLGITEVGLPDLYLSSVLWAKDVYQV